MWHVHGLVLEIDFSYLEIVNFDFPSKFQMLSNFPLCSYKSIDIHHFKTLFQMILLTGGVISATSFQNVFHLFPDLKDLIIFDF